MTTAYARPMSSQMATEALNGTTRGLTGLRRLLGEYQLYRRTVTELRALSQRELNDLGISSYDVSRIARESVWGK